MSMLDLVSHCVYFITSKQLNARMQCKEPTDSIPVYPIASHCITTSGQHMTDAT